MRARLPLPVLALLFIFTLSAATPAAAQFGKLKDKVKSKVERKVDQKTDQAIDKTIDGAVDGTGKDGEAPAPADPAEPATPGADGDKATAPAAGGTAVAEDMTLYTKYDFVPGDKVIFYDDLANEELGEFPRAGIPTTASSRSRRPRARPGSSAPTRGPSPRKSRWVRFPTSTRSRWSSSRRETTAGT
ncbi:MAG: hypothetical protein IPH48_17165 [bacterium]|nr:hypothetical protein [bacterium]